MASKHALKFRWRRPANRQTKMMLKRAKSIATLRNRGSICESLKAEHQAIDTALQCLEAAVVYGGTRAEIIQIMNAMIAFCAVHFVAEETFMRDVCHSRLGAHTAAHKRLFERVVAARRRASGEGISLATLDLIDVLHAFHRHITAWDQHMMIELPITRNRVLTASHA